MSNVLLLGAALQAMRRADSRALYRQSAADAAFYCTAQSAAQEAAHLQDHRFPSGVLHRRTWKQRRLFLRLLLRLTRFWRRRVDRFEVLGLDQARRLAESGIQEERIRLKRDPSPVAFQPGLLPLSLPNELRGEAGVILYSGNWGVAHDENTFIEAYSQYIQQSKNGLRFWLNATGAKADRVERELRARGTPIYRSRLVPLEDLPRLLLAADVHLITLRDPFVGYVMPSKIYSCIEFRKTNPICGSASSDVHLVAKSALSADRYLRVDVGDVKGIGGSATCHGARHREAKKID